MLLLEPPQFQLVDLGAYPGLLKKGRTAVKGELYEVNNDTLQDLDFLEEVPTLYTREVIQLPDGQKVWTYFLQPQPDQHMRNIPSGDYFSVSSEASDVRK